MQHKFTSTQSRSVTTLHVHFSMKCQVDLPNKQDFPAQSCGQQFLNCFFSAPLWPCWIMRLEALCTTHLSRINYLFIRKCRMNLMILCSPTNYGIRYTCKTHWKNSQLQAMPHGKSHHNMANSHYHHAHRVTSLSYITYACDSNHNQLQD